MVSSYIGYVHCFTLITPGHRTCSLIHVLFQLMHTSLQPFWHKKHIIGQHNVIYVSPDTHLAKWWSALPNNATSAQLCPSIERGYFSAQAQGGDWTCITASSYIHKVPHSKHVPHHTCTQSLYSPWPSGSTCIISSFSASVYWLPIVCPLLLTGGFFPWRHRPVFRPAALYCHTLSILAPPPSPVLTLVFWFHMYHILLLGLSILVAYPRAPTSPQVGFFHDVIIQ